MSIYNDYGMLKQEYTEAISNIDKVAFQSLLDAFPDASSEDIRTLSFEIREGIAIRTAEELLIRSMKARKLEREGKRVRASKLQVAENSIPFEPVEYDPEIQEGVFINDNPNEDEGDK